MRFLSAVNVIFTSIEIDRVAGTSWMGLELADRCEFTRYQEAKVSD